MAARSDGVVSPVRTAAVIVGAGIPAACGERVDTESGLGQVLVDVRAQRLERRDVEHANLVGQGSPEALLEQIVDRRQERREGLSRAGRRGNQGVPSARNGFPATVLRGGRGAQCGGKPLAHERVEEGERHGRE